jgi:hypothetical protein
MKLEVGKKYVLNDGEVFECTHIDDDGYYIIDECQYDADGTFRVAGGRMYRDYCVSHEYIEDTTTDNPYDPAPDYAEQAAIHGICITIKVGAVVISYDGRD